MTGILKVFEKKYPTTDDTCARRQEEMRNARALTLQEAAAAFVILGTGILMATTILFLELLIEGVQKAFNGASRLEQNQCTGEREPMPSAFEMKPMLFSLEMISSLRTSEIEQSSRTSEIATLAD